MPYTFLDHTADVAVELTASSAAGLMAQGAIAITDTLTHIGRDSRDEVPATTVSAPELDLLLLDGACACTASRIRACKRMRIPT